MISTKIPIVNDWIDMRTHNGRDGKGILLGVLEETEDIVADNDAGLAAKLLKDTHYEVCTKIFGFVEI